MEAKDSSVFKHIAHRGALAEAPENTIPAFEIAFQKYRCDMAEMDLRLTRDGVAVVFHDATLERVTNGKGFVKQHTLREIKTLDAGYWFDPTGEGKFPYRGRGITIPTLEEVLTRFPTSQFCLELKDYKGVIVERTLQVLGRILLPSRVIIGSFRGKIARRLRRLCRNPLETFLAEDEIIWAYLKFLLGFKKIAVPAFHASIPRAKYGIQLDRGDWIEFLHRQGVRVYYWTVNDAEEMEGLIRRGADGIVTDYPDRLSRN